MGSKRIFVGVMISRKVQHIISLLESTIPSTTEGIRWVQAKNMHLTLSFLGDIAESRITSLQNDLEDLRQFEKFGMSIAGTNIFPNVEKPRVLWLSVDEGSNALVQLQAKTAEICAPYIEDGAKIKPFTPHLTVARLNAQFKPWKTDMNQFIGAEYSPVRFEIRSVFLYQSELFPTGARYSVLAEYPLR